MKEKKNLWSRSIFWGLVLVAAAVVLILNGAGVNLGTDISWWRILFGVVFAAILVERLIKCKFSQIFFPLAFIYILFEPPLAKAVTGGEKESLISNWIVLLAALLLTIGMGLLLPKRDEESGAVVKGHVGNSTLYFDGANLGECWIKNKVGRTVVYFTNKEAYAGNGVINVTENVGQITLYIPGEWNVVTTGSDNLGKINIPVNEKAGEKSITLSVSENLGVIDVTYC